MLPCSFRAKQEAPDLPERPGSFTHWLHAARRQTTLSINIIRIFLR